MVIRTNEEHFNQIMYQLSDAFIMDDYFCKVICHLRPYLHYEDYDETLMIDGIKLNIGQYKLEVINKSELVYCMIHGTSTNNAIRRNIEKEIEYLKERQRKNKDLILRLKEQLCLKEGGTSFGTTVIIE